MLSTPSPWTHADSSWKTPPERMYSFGDVHGRCCPSWLPAWDALRLAGDAVMVDAAVDYGDARKLCSAVDMFNISGASDHGASVMDCCTPRTSPGGRPVFAPVWEHMLLHAAAYPEIDFGGAHNRLSVRQSRASSNSACTCQSFP